MKFKIKIWKEKGHGHFGDWQLRIVKGDVLIERDAGSLVEILSLCSSYKDKNPDDVQNFTINLFGCGIGEGDVKSPRLSKKERGMIRCPKVKKETNVQASETN